MAAQKADAAKAFYPHPSAELFSGEAREENDEFTCAVLQIVRLRRNGLFVVPSRKHSDQLQ